MCPALDLNPGLLIGAAFIQCHLRNHSLPRASLPLYGSAEQAGAMEPPRFEFCSDSNPLLAVCALCLVTLPLCASVL